MKYFFIRIEHIMLKYTTFPNELQYASLNLQKIQACQTCLVGYSTSWVSKITLTLPVPRDNITASRNIECLWQSKVKRISRNFLRGRKKMYIYTHIYIHTHTLRQEKKSFSDELQKKMEPREKQLQLCFKTVKLLACNHVC